MLKIKKAAAMADLVTVNKFNAIYWESVGIIHIYGILTVLVIYSFTVPPPP
jgi:hypothetical protein